MQEFEDFEALRSQALPRTAYLLCGGGKGAAEDILQDVLMSMCGKWRRIRPSPGGARPHRAGERGREPAGGGVPQRDGGGTGARVRHRHGDEPDLMSEQVLTWN